MSDDYGKRNGLTLTVKSADSRDKGRRFARLSPDSMLHLKITPGDTIEIEGEKTTVAQAWRADRADWDDVIILNSLMMTNCGSEIGDEVSVRRADITNATEIGLTPLDDAQLESPFNTSIIKRLIQNTPVAQGDIIPARINSMDRIEHTKFGIKYLNPGPVAKITDNTEFFVLPISSEQNSENKSNLSKYDVFVCHASEDKERIVRPLCNSLSNLGMRVWYDEFQLQIGDSLRESIDEGLAQSRYGIVVLSPDFFEKNWTQYELNGLVQKDIDEKTILPIKYNISIDEIKNHSPPLSDKYMLEITNENIDNISFSIYKEVMS